MKPVIFTDLDGTLLDSLDYSFEAALPALKLAKEMAVPVVFTSSKTRAEIEAIRKDLSNEHPFIAENGGGIFIPEGYFPFTEEGMEKFDGYNIIRQGRKYPEVREGLKEISLGLKARIKGFGDMETEEISALTNLTPDMAGLAKKREFDEPFVFDGAPTEAEEMIKRALAKGLTIERGRLYHIHGDHDKGKSAVILKKFYRELFGRITPIAIGDAPNDIPLLKEAEYPVLVKKADGTYDDIELPGLIKAEGIGPRGWVKAVTGILESIRASRKSLTC